jgi:vacuolar-type H+-ATPase subunit F/Vma7
MGMTVAEFIGDEVSAAGFRLCGIDVHITDGKDVMSLINQARERASLVLVSSSAVQDLNRAELDALLSSIEPAVLIVPDVRGLNDVPDIVPRIHKQLGMLE